MRHTVLFLTLAGPLFWVLSSHGQEDVQFNRPQIQTNKEVLLSLTAPAGKRCRIEVSPDLVKWTGLSTVATTANTRQTDSAAPFAGARFYRANMSSNTTLLTGDHLATSDGELTIHPINHATFIMAWGGKVIASDPVGGSARFSGLPKADLIVITHDHSDHFDNDTIDAIKNTNVVILAPAKVYQSLKASLKAVATILRNGSSTNWSGVTIDAVPAYNLTSSFHPKGDGNGYVVTIGGKRIYISGDTEDIPEMAALQDIDLAFVCMNLPYTMTVDKAAAIVRKFQPKVIYPYHYSASDVNRFKRLVGTDLGTEVRLRPWE